MQFLWMLWFHFWSHIMRFSFVWGCFSFWNFSASKRCITFCTARSFELPNGGGSVAGIFSKLRYWQVLERRDLWHKIDCLGCMPFLGSITRESHIIEKALDSPGHAAGGTNHRLPEAGVRYHRPYQTNWSGVLVTPIFLLLEKAVWSHKKFWRFSILKGFCTTFFAPDL